MPSDAMIQQGSARPPPTGMAPQLTIGRNITRATHCDLGLFADMRHRAAIDSLPDVRYNDLGDEDDHDIMLLVDERAPTEPLEPAAAADNGQSHARHRFSSNAFTRKDSLLDPRPDTHHAALVSHDGPTFDSLIQDIVARHGQWLLISPDEATRVGEYIRPIQPEGLEAYLNLELTNLRAVRDSESSGACSRANSPTSTRAELTPLEYLVLDSYYLTQENRGLRAQIKSLEQSNRHMSTEKTCLELRCEHVSKELARVERQLRHLYAHLALESHQPLDRVEKLCSALTREGGYLAKIHSLEVKAEATERRLKASVKQLATEHLDRLQFERRVIQALKVFNGRLAMEQDARAHSNEMMLVHGNRIGKLSSNLHTDSDDDNDDDQDIVESASPTPRAALLHPFAELRRQANRLAIQTATVSPRAGSPTTPPNTPAPKASLDPCSTRHHYPGCSLCRAGGACIAKLISDSFSAKDELTWFDDIQDDVEKANDDCVTFKCASPASGGQSRACQETIFQHEDVSLYDSPASDKKNAVHPTKASRTIDLDETESTCVQAVVALPSLSAATMPPLAKVVPAAHLSGASVFPAPITIVGRRLLLPGSGCQTDQSEVKLSALEDQSCHRVHRGPAEREATATNKASCSGMNAVKHEDFDSELVQSPSTHNDKRDTTLPTFDNLSINVQAQDPQAPMTYAMLRARFAEIRAKWSEPLAALTTSSRARQALESEPCSSRLALRGVVSDWPTVRNKCNKHPLEREPTSVTSTPMATPTAAADSAQDLSPTRYQVPIPISAASSASFRLAASLRENSGKVPAQSEGLFYPFEKALHTSDKTTLAQPSSVNTITAAVAADRPDNDDDSFGASQVFASGPHSSPIIVQPSIRYTTSFISTKYVKQSTVSRPLDTAQVSTDLAKAMYGIVSGVADMARRIRSEADRHVNATEGRIH